MKYNVNGNGFKGSTIAAQAHDGLCGTWDAGTLYVPCMASLRNLMPKKWHRAFDRCKNTLWWNEKGCGRLDIFDWRGRLLTQVFIHPVKE